MNRELGLQRFSSSVNNLKSLYISAYDISVNITPSDNTCGTEGCQARLNQTYDPTTDTWTLCGLHNITTRVGLTVIPLLNPLIYTHLYILICIMLICKASDLRTLILKKALLDL